MAILIQFTQHLFVLALFLLVTKSIRAIQSASHAPFVMAAVTVLVVPVFFVPRNWWLVGITSALFLVAGYLFGEKAK